jgi:hypothetical protein
LICRMDSLSWLTVGFLLEPNVPLVCPARFYSIVPNLVPTPITTRPFS